MDIGQRINIIKKLINHFLTMKVHEVELVLGQFKIPTYYEQWPNNDHSYFLSLIEKEPDDKLIGIYSYFFPTELLPGNYSSKEVVETGSFKIFCSHSSTKKLIVSQVKDELRTFGLECFVAHEDIEPTKEWLKELISSLLSCHAFIAFLCNDFKTSNFCDQEVGYALNRGIPFIPIRLENDPYGFMGPYQGVTGRGQKPEQISSAVHAILLGNPSSKLAVLNKLVDSLLASSNYALSSKLLKILEGQVDIPGALISKIGDNWKSNKQISGCRGIPERMNNLLSKNGYFY